VHCKRFFVAAARKGKYLPTHYFASKLIVLRGLRQGNPDDAVPEVQGAVAHAELLLRPVDPNPNPNPNPNPFRGILAACRLSDELLRFRDCDVQSRPCPLGAYLSVK
jgi:hypothetical protein